MVIQPTQVALRTGIQFDVRMLRIREECESGRIGTIGNRVKGNLPWVQIPPPPPLAYNEMWPLQVRNPS
jgi:hypothetical protein